MGYTHYFKLKKPAKGTAEATEKLYQQALKDCRKVVKAYQATAASEERLSGYSAHTDSYGGLSLNGKGDLAHEDFSLREHYSQNLEGFGAGFGFCKTAQKPYDVAVTACLAVLKYRLGDLIEVSSDGRRVDWAYGTLLAATTLKRKVPNPIAAEPVSEEPAERPRLKLVK